MRASDIRWDCSTHQRPVNASCVECTRVVNALKDAFPAMRAVKMRRLAAELMLEFAACQHGLSIAGDYGRTPEAERETRRTLHVAAHQFASATPPRRRR